MSQSKRRRDAAAAKQRRAAKSKPREPDTVLGASMRRALDTVDRKRGPMSNEEREFFNRLDGISTSPTVSGRDTPAAPAVDFLPDEPTRKVIRVVSKDKKKSTMFTPTPGQSVIGAWKATGSRKQCRHYGTELLYASRGVELYGAQGALVEPGDFDLIIDCGQTQLYTTFVGGNEFFSSRLEPLVHRAHLVKLYWADQGAPPVRLPFWRMMWYSFEAFAATVGAMPLRVCLVCIGSHGRTGTALVSLMIADGMPRAGALAHIRTTHCPHAVENPTQEKYLETLELEKETADLTQT